jgi:ribose 5-phosphate isomerase B
MKIAIAADHGGFEAKQALIEHFETQGIILDDLGTYDTNSVDYPDYADKMAARILHHDADWGILICGTGIGISIAANRHKGIRAALLYDDFSAEMAKRHNNANIIAFGGRTMATDDMIRRIGIFMSAAFEGGRHQKRLDKLDR